jgi:tetratricopeptide (TPR) repeat protein
MIMKFSLRFTLAIAAVGTLGHADERVMERAMLRIEVINQYEEIAKKADDEERKKSAEAMMAVLFRELKTDFNPKDLDNYELVRIGDLLRIKTATPRDAMPYYDEAIGREDQSYRYYALQGRADVYGLSPDVKDMDKAISDFTQIYENSPEKPQREYALFRKIEVLMKKKDYAKVDEWARVYLDRNKAVFAKFSPQVGLMLAQSLDNRNMAEDAIAMYVKIWSVWMGNMKVSTPAVTRWMELMWARNNPGDRQAAYEKGATFLGLTTRFKDKLTKEELSMFEGVEKLVQTYEADPEIKKMSSMEGIRRSKQKK